MKHVMTLDREVYDHVMDEVAGMPHKVGRPYVIAVLLTLARFTKRDDVVDLTINQVAESTGFSKTQVQRSIDAGTRAQVLETLTRGGSVSRRGSRRLWKLCAPNSTPTEEPAGNTYSTPNDTDSTPEHNNPTPLRKRSQKDSQSSSLEISDMGKEHPRTRNIEGLIVLRREAAHTGTIRHHNAWRTQVLCDVRATLGANIRDLVRRFPTAPDATIADAAESGDNRCLAPYVELLNEGDGELTVQDVERRDMIEKWSKDWFSGPDK